MSTHDPGPERQPFGQVSSRGIRPPWRVVGDSSRTSTVRASIITTTTLPEHTQRSVPNVNRSGKYNHSAPRQHKMPSSLVPNVNRSGKYHHPTMDMPPQPESYVPNVNRSGKYHHSSEDPRHRAVYTSRTSTVRPSLNPRHPR